MRRIVGRVLRLLRFPSTGVAKVQADLRRLPPDHQELRGSLVNGYNFTERVRKALALAREEAAALRHEYVGTEHVLLGMLREGGGLGCAILDALEVDRRDLRSAILQIVQPGKTAFGDKMKSSVPTGPDLPYTSRAKRILELAMTEARELRHSYVGTEHLLLGVLREDKGIAAQVLGDFGVDIENARDQALRLLAGAVNDSTVEPPADRTALSTFPKRLTEVLAAAYGVAARRRTLAVTHAHVAIALLEHNEGLANAVLDRIGFDRPAAIARLTELAPMGDMTIGPDDVMHSNSMISTIQVMEQIQRDARAPTPGTHHLLLSLLATSPEIATVFAAQNVDSARLDDEIRRISG